MNLRSRYGEYGKSFKLRAVGFNCCPEIKATNLTNLMQTTVVRVKILKHSLLGPTTTYGKHLFDLNRNIVVYRLP